MTCCGVFPHDDDIASIMDRLARNFAEKAPVFREPIPPRLHLRLCTLLGYLFRSPSVQYSIISTQNDTAGSRGQAYQPSERIAAGAQRVSSFEGGIGIDATVPFAFKSDFRRARYPVEMLDFRKWFSEREIEEMREQQSEYFRFLGKTGFA